jgi:hypothetical protein
MILSRRSAVSMALTLSLVALVPNAIRAQDTKIEVYPGPGVDTHKSSLYAVEVFDGTSWIPTYVYMFSRKSVCHWHYGTHPSVNFVTFGTLAPVDVRVTKLNGPITGAEVSPHSKLVPVHLSGGQAIGTLNPNDKLWLTINGDDANPLFLFADAPKPSIPPGATYFGPGITDIAPAASNHYKASSNEVIYLDGGAWVRGNIDIRGTRNVQILGPGVLSGDLWRGESVGASALPFDDFLNYVMVRGDWFGGNGASVRGITIVDSPGYNFFGGAAGAYGVKILSPWFFSTDGFQGVSHVDHSFCFNGDNVFMPMWAGVQNDDITYTACFVGTTNNSVFAGGYWGNSPSPYTAFADDIDIKTYNNDDWVSGGAPLLASAFQTWVDNSDSTKGYSNQTYQNIRIEGNIPGPLLQLKNLLYPFAPSNSPNPPLGNSYNLVFRNISLEGTQKYLSEVKGWDANNGFHNVVADNVRINGQLVTASNLGQYFAVNSYVWESVVTANADYLAGVVPVVGSVAGSGGSYFKTAMQVYNPSSTDYTFRVVFHTSGVSGGAGDPSAIVTVPAGGVVYDRDLLPAIGIPTGLGSLDIFIPTGETRKVATTFRVYNDAGATGTSGFNEDLASVNTFFRTGDKLLLICSPDPTKFRFNVGVRTLGDGAAMVATLRSSSGAVLKTVTKSYPANFFQQTTLDAFLGGATVVGNESLSLHVTAGEAIVYGATVDDRTNDSSMGIAQRQ